MKLAEVVLTHGRYFLVVGDVYVAMETDLCRDGEIEARFWDKASLDQAAERINKAPAVAPGAPGDRAAAGRGE